MGVLTLQLLVCGQLILFSLAVGNTAYPHRATESPSKLINTSEIKPTAAPHLNTTGNYTENNASALSSNSTYNSSNTNLTTSTSQMTPTRHQGTTWAPPKSNITVTGSTIQPNKTTAHTTQSSTSAYRTTISTNSTASTSRYNTTYSSTTISTPLTTSAVTKTTVKASTTVAQPTGFTPQSLNSNLSHSEKSLTIFFSILLGVIALIILVYVVYKFSKRKQARVQYIHRRLQSEDTGEQFAVSDDTLVISGGLYDGPQIYNPTMTVQNEEDCQTEAPGFPYRPTQFRLEFLREDHERALDHDTDTFQTFHENDQEP